MAIRCEKCGELIWYTEENETKHLKCGICGKAADNPSYKEKELEGDVYKD
jgi:hypothetical protein